jgi:hypothetical protein
MTLYSSNQIQYEYSLLPQAACTHKKCSAEQLQVFCDSPLCDFLVISPAMASKLNIVVEGCCHGELDKIYASIARMEEDQGVKVDLLLCCGDFQALRSKDDFEAMAVPDKFKCVYACQASLLEHLQRLFNTIMSVTLEPLARTCAFTGRWPHFIATTMARRLHQ